MAKMGASTDCSVAIIQAILVLSKLELTLTHTIVKIARSNELVSAKNVLVKFVVVATSYFVFITHSVLLKVVTTLFIIIMTTSCRRFIR